jgi:hypothetical protein
MFSLQTSRHFLLMFLVILLSPSWTVGDYVTHENQASVNGQGSPRIPGKRFRGKSSKKHASKARRRHKKKSGESNNTNASNLNASTVPSASPSPSAVPSPSPSASPSPSVTPTPTPCPPVKETSVQSVKISSKGLELSGFPQSVNIAVLIGAGLFFVASLLLARKAVKEDSKKYVIPAIAVGIGFLVLLFFVGRVFDRRGTTSEVREKIEKATQESRGQLPAVAPVAPSDLTLSPVSASQINLSWADNSDTEEGFKIERKLGVEGNYAQLVILGPNANSYADVGLAPETNASYRIKAFNTSGESPYTNEASVTTLAMAVKSNDITWSNPAIWFRYVIFPVLIMVLFLCVFLAYMVFWYLRIRRY